MKTKNIWLLAVPTAFLALAGCGGGSDNGPNFPNATPVPSPVPNVTPLPGETYNNRVIFSAVSSNSNVNRAEFRANQSSVDRSESGIAILRLTDQDSIVQSRRLVINGPFSPSTVGQSIPLALSGGPGVATADFQQNTGGTVRRWQAASGTIVVDRYMGATATGFEDQVRFRLINATFVPNSDLDKGTGNFTLNVSGAIN